MANGLIYFNETKRTKSGTSIMDYGYIEFFKHNNKA